MWKIKDMAILIIAFIIQLIINSNKIYNKYMDIVLIKHFIGNKMFICIVPYYTLTIPRENPEQRNVHYTLTRIAL